MATWVDRGTTLAKLIKGVSGWTVRLSLPTEAFWKYAPWHVHVLILPGCEMPDLVDGCGGWSAMKTKG